MEHIHTDHVSITFIFLKFHLWCLYIGFIVYFNVQMTLFKQAKNGPRVVSQLIFYFGQWFRIKINNVHSTMKYKFLF